MRLSRKENQEITRERLRAAAAREFARRGVSAASIDAIAEAAGFSRGAFYANYRCKHDLLLEILKAVQKQELTAWQDMVQHAGALEDALPALAARFDAFLAADTGGLLAIELRLEAQRNPDFGSHYEASRAEVFELSLGLVRALLRKAGASEGEVGALALALRAMATGLNFDTDHRTQGAPSRGEIMALFVKRMMSAPGRATGAVRRPDGSRSSDRSPSCAPDQPARRSVAEFIGELHPEGRGGPVVHVVDADPCVDEVQR